MFSLKLYRKTSLRLIASVEIFLVVFWKSASAGAKMLSSNRLAARQPVRKPIKNKPIANLEKTVKKECFFCLEGVGWGILKDIVFPPVLINGHAK